MTHVSSTARIYQIHQLIQSGQPVTLLRLMEVFEVSKATVKRDIALLRDQLGAPLIFDSFANTYRYDQSEPEFELPGMWFNDSELYALLASEQLLEAVQPGLLTQHIGPLRARIRNLLEQSGHNPDTITSLIRLQPVAQRSVAPEPFGIVTGALLNNHVLSLEYHGRQRGAATQRHVHPQKLMHYRGNWYLAAWCEKANDLRTFALERIHCAKELEQPAKTIEADTLERYLGAGFGIFTGEAKEWAVLRFTANTARWVADEIWHPDQKSYWIDEEFELQVPYSDDRELQMDILKYGPEVEVIAPESLRKTIKKRLQEALERYK